MPTHHQGPPEEVRALDAYIKLVRAYNSLGSRLVPRLAESGLTEGQFGVLEALFHLGPLYQCDLARKHLQSGGNITMIVDNLEKAALVRRERSVEDRRYVRVHLTPEGRKLIKKIFPRHAQAVTQELSVLTAAEQEELARLCRLLGRGASNVAVPANQPIPVEMSDETAHLLKNPRNAKRLVNAICELDKGNGSERHIDLDA